MFNYKVTKVEAHQITVSYPDESWSVIPIFEGESKEVLEERIAQYYHPVTEGVKDVSAIPFVEGEEYVAEEVSSKPIPANIVVNEEGKVQGELVYDYKALRAMSYPSVEDQLQAMFLARQGDTSLLEDLDDLMKNVNSQYPSDMEPMTMKEYQEMIEDFSDL